MHYDNSVVNAYLEDTRLLLDYYYVTTNIVFINKRGIH